jgi:hypothetical protein
MFTISDGRLTLSHSNVPDPAISRSQCAVSAEPVGDLPIFIEPKGDIRELPTRR